MTFIIVGLLIWVLCNAYLGWRLIESGTLSKRTRIVLWILFVITQIQFPLVMINRRINGISSDFFKWIEAYAYLSFGFFAILGLLLVFRDFLWMVTKVGFFLQRRFAKDPSPNLQDATKRQFFSNTVNLGLTLAATSASSVGYHQATKIPDLKYVDVPIENLPPELVGFTIVQISDTHVGPSITGEFLRQVVEKINGVNAHIVALTGDFVDGMVPELQSQTHFIKDIKATHGLAYCTGNHEYYWDGPGWCQEVERLGGHVLIDKHMVIEHNGCKVLVAGVADYSMRNAKLPGHDSSPLKAKANAPPHDVSILLAHQPKSIWEAAEAEFDLQLSGHTHGGQFWPWNYFVGLAHPFSAGLGTYNKTKIYVSHGTGFWGPPNRFLVPSEITVLRLTRA